MKKIWLLLILLCYVNSYSQLEKHQTFITSQVGGRYEIAQSEIKRSNTFKLDKYTGKVYAFVTTKSDWFTWQEIPKSVVTSDIIISEKINYQLFMGGILAKDCFLLNINTGVTWVLVEDKKSGNLFFEVFE